VLGGVAAVLSLGCSGGGSGPGSGPGGKGDKGDGGAKAQPRKADFSLTAEELTREFFTNEKEAAKKYQGKVVEVTGEVAAVQSKDRGKYVIVQLKGAKKNEKDLVGTLVQVGLLPEFHKTGVQLSRKQKVKLTGEYELGLGFLVNVTRGSLEELSKSDLVSTTASELAGEFAKDAKAAAAKYEDRELIVAGEVEDVTKKGDFHYARLKGDGKLGVSVILGPEEAAVMKKGQQARVRGELGFPAFEKNEVRLASRFLLEAK
jgi:hypothetical protein